MQDAASSVAAQRFVGSVDTDRTRTVITHRAGNGRITRSLGRSRLIRHGRTAVYSHTNGTPIWRLVQRRSPCACAVVIFATLDDEHVLLPAPNVAHEQPSGNIIQLGTPKLDTRTTFRHQRRLQTLPQRQALGTDIHSLLRTILSPDSHYSCTGSRLSIRWY